MFRKLKQKRMYEEIASQVMEAIVRGDLGPNDKLPPEKELVEIFGVSRVTVREAIRSLEQSGVIEVRQGSTGGAYIKEPDINEVVDQIENALRMSNLTIQQLSEARAAIEGIVISKFISSKIADDDIARMRANMELAEQYYRAEKHDRRLSANFEFHRIIVELAENPVLSMTHKLVVGLSIPFFEIAQPSILMFKTTMKEHLGIINLLEKRDFRRASDLCMKHILEVGGKMAEKSKMQSVFGRFKERSSRSSQNGKGFLSGKPIERDVGGGDKTLSGDKTGSTA